MTRRHVSSARFHSAHSNPALTRRTMMRPLVAGLLAAIAWGGLPAERVEAQAAIPAEVVVILAKEEAGTIDPSLESMTALRRAPFNAFRTMTIVNRQNERLRPGRDQDIRLPNGRTLRVQLQRVMPDGRFRVRVSIDRPDADAYLPLLQVVASPGDPFFVAGQSHDGGTLVIGIRLGG